VIYASGFNGIAGTKPDELAEDLEPLFQAIVKEVAPPTVVPDAPLQMLVSGGLCCVVGILCGSCSCRWQGHYHCQ
jgi:predicted membrane GTPase involved in stress response